MALTPMREQGNVQVAHSGPAPEALWRRHMASSKRPLRLGLIALVEHCRGATPVRVMSPSQIYWSTI
jgi:hypothetical protein